MSYYIKVYSYHGSTYDADGNSINYILFNEYGPMSTWGEVEEQLRVLKGYDNIEIIDRD